MHALGLWQGWEGAQRRLSATGCMGAPRAYILGQLAGRFFCAFCPWHMV